VFATALVVAGSLTLSSCGTVTAPVVASITSITPATGPMRGGTPVTIVGSNLSGVTAVRFGTAAAQFTVVDNTEVTTVAPPGSGAVDVTVGTDGASASGAHVDFSYVVPPRITSISVSSGSARGGTRLVVHGAGFSPSTMLLIGRHHARVVAIPNSTKLFAITPAGFGTDEVRVATSGGVSATSARTTFRYRTKVLVIGDSLGIDLGWGFAVRRSIGGTLTVTDDSVGSTGLVRSDFYNWPQHLRQDLVTLHPDVVVVLFGANDEQSISTPHGLARLGTAAWASAYARRIRQLVSVAAAHNATLLWVALPRMAPTSDLSPAFVAEVDRIGRVALRGEADAIYVSTSTLFTTPSGRYTPYVRLAPHVVENGRQPDGVHLTPAGATAMDDLVASALQQLG
jgi:lysophospholipase L1-like esterase